MDIEQRIQTRLTALQERLAPYLRDILEGNLQPEDYPSRYDYPRRHRELFGWIGAYLGGRDFQYMSNPFIDDVRALSLVQRGQEQAYLWLPNLGNVDEMLQRISAIRDRTDLFIRHVGDLSEYLRDFLAGRFYTGCGDEFRQLQAPEDLMEDLTLLLADVVASPLTEERMNNFSSRCWESLQPEEGTMYRAWLLFGPSEESRRNYRDSIQRSYRVH